MHITVIPEDKAVIVDGAALRFDFTAPENLHALQWRGDAGHMEFTDGPNRTLAAEDYERVVAPYLALWEAEKKRLEAETGRPPTLDEARAAKLTEVMSAYQAAFKPIEAIYPATEREGWPIQEAEARAVLANPKAETPVLSTLVEMRGRKEKVKDLATKILTNAATWATVYAVLTGQQQRMYADVSALTTVEEVQAYPVAYQMPGELTA